MMYEFANIKTLECEDDNVYVLKLEEAIGYKQYLLRDNILIGAFLNDLGEVIGINTYSGNDIYSPKKLLESIDGMDDNGKMEVTEHENILGWWNENVPLKKKKSESTTYDEVEITRDQLKDYFIETVEKSDYDDYDNSVWYTYYLNPPQLTGIELKLGNETIISYDFMDIYKIMIVETSNHKRIYFYDQKLRWVEDNDISTKLPWNRIRFVFSEADLQNSSTVDGERQAYIELYEMLDPYETTETTHEILQKWLDDNKQYFRI